MAIRVLIPEAKQVAEGTAEALMEIDRAEPNGQYALAVAYSGIVHTAGIVAADLSADLKGQTRQIFVEIDRLLALFGTDKSRLLSVNVWLKSISDFDAMNESWTDWIDAGNLPVRATVEARLADERIFIEIMVTAARR